MLDEKGRFFQVHCPPFLLQVALHERRARLEEKLEDESPLCCFCLLWTKCDMRQVACELKNFWNFCQQRSQATARVGWEDFCRRQPITAQLLNWHQSESGLLVENSLVFHFSVKFRRRCIALRRKARNSPDYPFLIRVIGILKQTLWAPPLCG